MAPLQTAPPQTPSYLIPLGDMTLPDRQAKRVEVDTALQTAALDLSIRQNVADLVIRDTLPSSDLSITGVGPINNQTWQLPAPGVAGINLQYFNQVIGQNQCIAFWGVSSPMAAPSISSLSFFLGGAATTLFVAQLEQLFARFEVDAFFSYPLIFSRNRTARCTVMPRVAFAAFTEFLVLHARTVEPLGDTISAPAS